MRDFHVCNWLLSYGPLKILAILVIPIKRNIIFVNLDKNANSSCTHVGWQSKNHSESIWFYVSIFFIKDTMPPKCF